MEALNKLSWAAKSPIFKKVSEISDISALFTRRAHKTSKALRCIRQSCISLVRSGKDARDTRIIDF